MLWRNKIIFHGRSMGLATHAHIVTQMKMTQSNSCYHYRKRMIKRFVIISDSLSYAGLALKVTWGYLHFIEYNFSTIMHLSHLRNNFLLYLSILEKNFLCYLLLQRLWGESMGIICIHWRKYLGMTLLIVTNNVLQMWTTKLEKEKDKKQDKWEQR